MAQEKTQVDNTIKRVVKYLKQTFCIEAIVLFGSRVSGKHTKFSDIDLAIFSSDVEKWDVEKKVRTIVKIHKLFGLDIEPHFFPAKSLKEARPTNFVGYILKTGRKIT